MRRLGFALLLGAIASLAITPVLAAKPDRYCGGAASGWHTVTLMEWLEATEEAGLDIPEAEEQAFLDGLAAAWDKNNDGLVCTKPFQPTLTPAFDPWFFNAKDNTSAAGGS